MGFEKRLPGRCSRRGCGLQNAVAIDLGKPGDGNALRQDRNATLEATCGEPGDRERLYSTAAGAAAMGLEVAMRIGMVGLGRMGANMVRRLLEGGHECVAYDHTA